MRRKSTYLNLPYERYYWGMRLWQRGVERKELDEKQKREVKVGDKCVICGDWIWYFVREGKYKHPPGSKNDNHEVLTVREERKFSGI